MIISSDYTPLFIPLVLLSIALIIALDCVWRARQKLDVFLKLLAAAIALFAIGKLVTLVSLFGGEAPGMLSRWIEAGAALFVLLAMVEMYRLIRELDHEDTTQ